MTFNPQLDACTAHDGVTIHAVKLLLNGQAVNVFEGGELVDLLVEFTTEVELHRPIVLFDLKDRLGQILLSDNTQLSYSESFSPGQSYQARFRFHMPPLNNGDYIIDSAVLEDGEQKKLYAWHRDRCFISFNREFQTHGLIPFYTRNEIITQYEISNQNSVGSKTKSFIEPGPYVVDAPQTPLNAEEMTVVNQFHQLYYSSWIQSQRDTINLSWFGVQTLKCPLDLWIYQEIIVRTRPQFVIETGTRFGGSALFLASICDLLGQGTVISIDVERRSDWPQHPRIQYVHGSSTDRSTIEHVLAITKGSRQCMVVLDSDHREFHVYQEIMAYKDMVGYGYYLVVEDTNINGHPAFPTFGPGPMEAVTRFINETQDFEVDHRCERFLMTLNPCGYLRRITHPSQA